MKLRPLHSVLAFGLGAAVLFLGQIAWENLATCHQQYNLLNPARRCRGSLSQGEWNYEELRTVLEEKKASMKAAGTVTHISIYFQDLDNGPRFGIGEFDKFHPASLMKLPLLIFFLHAADLDPSLLHKTLTFTDELSVPANVATSQESMEPGTPYTIRELLKKMIVYSDNRSYAVLLRELHVLSESVAYTTFRDLDVLRMMQETSTTYVSISPYAKLYAILYNTGYLSKDMSQLALELLSQASFREGIVAGTPEGTRVAHKFGYTAIDGEVHLHDCGIVYHPKMAYVLCVMTTGTDQNTQSAAITDMSRTVFDAISKLDADHLSSNPLLLR